MTTITAAPEPLSAPLDRETFEAALRKIGEERYHDKHPFHARLHSGACTMDEVRAWVINRYYYQSRIPLKDAGLLSRCEDPALRRLWRRRIEDHDGDADPASGREGGLRRWLRLADAVGLDTDYVASARGVLPATRFAVDAYVRFVREQPFIAAVASSLTELFAPKIHKDRIAGLLEHYAFATPEAIAYFRHRVAEASEDVELGLAYVLDHARTAADQDQAIRALTFKTDVLWAQLDALWSAYVEPARVPPGGWRPPEGVR